MEQLFPSYEEIDAALMCLIYSRGGTLQPSETYEPLANYFNLSDRARTITRGEYFGRDNHPQSAWHCLVQWGRRDLVKADYVDQEAPRGIWKLTEQGRYQASLIINKYHQFLETNLSKSSPPASQRSIARTPLAADIKKPEETSRVEYTVYRILRDTALARKVKELHAYKCQICGQTLQLAEGLLYAEAHHIKPLGEPHNGPDMQENIICVCPNHHALLDYGAIRLDEEQLKSCGQHKLGSEYVEYHNTSIFGKARGVSPRRVVDNALQPKIRLS